MRDAIQLKCKPCQILLPMYLCCYYQTGIFFLSHLSKTLSCFSIVQLQWVYFQLVPEYKNGIFCRILSLRLKSCSLYRNSSCTQFLFVLYIIFFMYTNMFLLCYSAIGRTWKFWCIGSVQFLTCYSLYFPFL